MTDNVLGDSKWLSDLPELNGNMLKILALISMTFDHVGLLLMNDYLPFRIIGRLAFPIFAYMIAEGCYYTRNKKRYLAGIILLGALCQIMYYIADGSIYQGTLITFSLSIVMIYCVDYAKQQDKWTVWMLAALALVIVVFLCSVLPVYLKDTDYHIDYGLCGVLLPVLIFLPKRKSAKLLMATVGLIGISISMRGTQWFSLLSLIPLAMYGGERGKVNTKYLFYIYYPLHMAIIYGLMILFDF